MIKVLTACGNGMGSCQIIAMKLTTVFKKMGIDATVTHSNVSMAKSTTNGYQVLFTSQSLVPVFKAAEAKGVMVISLKNILSEAEMEEKIKSAITSKKLKVI